LETIGGSSMVASKPRRPPQAAHARTSIANTRRIRSAHAQERRTLSAAGDGCGHVGAAAVGGTAHDRVGGSVTDGRDEAGVGAVAARCSSPRWRGWRLFFPISYPIRVQSGATLCNPGTPETRAVLADRCIPLQSVPGFPGLENRQGASPRKFESYPFRFEKSVTLVVVPSTDFDAARRVPHLFPLSCRSPQPPTSRSRGRW
jgi:hypothetical protein